MADDDDPAIERLDLGDVAKQAAITLKTSFPNIVFTSGRRDTADQARAMGGNIVKSKNRQWIANTYVASEVRDACQKWVDANPAATNVADLADGLASVLETFDDDKLAKLSKHLAGMAFDVQPLSDANGGDKIKAAIAKLAGLDKFLENEGGLTVWHAQFKD